MPMLMMPRIPFYVEELAPGKPAEKAGIKPGDRIAGLNDQPTLFYDEFTPLARQNKGKPVSLLVLRGQEFVIMKLP